MKAQKIEGFSQKRRMLLGGTALAIGGLGYGFYSNFPMTKPLTTLQATVDTIVPADHVGGALETNVDGHLLERMKQKPTMQTLVERLTKGIESLSLKESRKPFAALSLDYREQLLEKVLFSSWQRQLRFDLEQLRDQVLEIYYQSELGRNSLDYVLPSNYPVYSRAEIT